MNAAEGLHKISELDRAKGIAELGDAIWALATIVALKVEEVDGEGHQVASIAKNQRR